MSPLVSAGGDVCTSGKPKCTLAYMCIVVHVTLPQPKAKYGEFKRLKSDRDRRAWLATFVLDPASGGCSAQSTTVVSNEQSEESCEMRVKYE